VQMWVYITRRALLVIPVIVGVMTITFLLISLVPLNQRVAASYGGGGRGALTQCEPCPTGMSGSCGGHVGECVNPLYARALSTLGLNQPAPVQWADYMARSLTLNWGYTNPNSVASTGAYLGHASYPVVEVLGWYLPYTLELALFALLIILVLAIPIGNYSAVHRNRPADQAARVMSFSGYALPAFLLGFLVLIGATYLSGGATPTCNFTSSHYTDWYGSWPVTSCLPGDAYPAWIGSHLQTSPTHFPTIDALINGDFSLAWQSFYRLILPALVIAYGYVAGILRFVRNSMLEVMNLDYVRTARAKGVSERDVVRRHAGRNSLNVTVTVLGLTFAFFITGFPVIEYVFGLRGIGYLLALSIQTPPDLGLIFGSTLLFTIIVVAANIIVDVVYAFLDPRVRLG
jgi:ABC-type dipeptide/oligopeptide/nickel transport system permease component